MTDSARVVFEVPANVPGRFDYRLETDIQPGELREDNNNRDVSLQVVDHKARVLLVDGDARWEFRYLKNLLDRDKQVEPDTVLLHQPFLGLLNRPYIPSQCSPRQTGDHCPADHWGYRSSGNKFSVLGCD